MNVTQSIIKEMENNYCQYHDILNAVSFNSFMKTFNEKAVDIDVVKRIASCNSWIV